MTTGADLYRLVEAYAGLGEHHRAGTVEDARTLDWFDGQLAALGARTERRDFTFDRYEASWHLTVDGVEVAALPLFYAGVGEIETEAPEIAALPAVAAGDPPGWDALAEHAAGRGAALALVATRSPHGRLVVPNRAPTRSTAGLPALLVPGALEGRLDGARIRARLAARIVPGTSASVLARLGPGPDGERLLLTTPLSGWFRCAGERGTGIAVMLAVARALAADGIPLLLNGNGGHELVDLGAHHFAASGVEARAVFHFGASVAAGEADGTGGLRLAEGLRVRTALDGHDQALVAAFVGLGRAPMLLGEGSLGHAQGWVGEARVWRTLGRPLISMAGPFPLFHTPEDIAASATTPALLEAVYQGALRAARLLNAATARRSIG
jgi:hypothetical protein